MPLGQLIYMPEESTPTIASEGNREAVAYLELSDHTDYYGRLFANAPKMWDKLLDIKRLAESGDDNGYEPYTLLEMIAQEVRTDLALAGKATGTSTRRIIAVRLEGGLVQDVTGVPEGYELRVEDYDEGDMTHPSWNAEKQCFVTVYEGGSDG